MRLWIISLAVISAIGFVIGIMIKFAWIAFPIILVLWFGTVIYGVIKHPD